MCQRAARCSFAVAVAGSPLRKWIGWDSGLEPHAYAARMRTRGAWGGALEMAVIAQLHGAAIHAHEKSGGAGMYRRIATFGDAGSAKVANVLYSGRCHYDALDVAAASL